MIRWLHGAMIGICVGSCGSDDGGPAAGAGTNATGSDGGEGGAGGELLGCPDGSRCRLVLVSQTLDDRIEIFATEGAMYRGAIDVDFKPNACDGCGLGDFEDGRLDEPFGLARAGGFLHVAVGHYPSRDSGSLLSFPLAMFEDMAIGSTLSVADYFASGTFSPPVIATDLGELEPIFVTARGSRLLIGTFNNDLFDTEDTWTRAGRLLVFDASDPAAAPGVVDLATVGCNGASQVVELSPTTIGVACDGNEAVAILDVTDLDATPLDEVANTVTGILCQIPGSMNSRRVRYLGPDGNGGFMVGEGPTPQDLLSASRLWHFGANCNMQGFVQLPRDGDWQLGEIEAFPGAASTWLLASGGATMMPNRGVYVVHNSGGALEVCQAIAGFDAFWETADGPIEPFGLAVTSDGSGLAVGAGPLEAPSAGPGYGRVLWADLDGFDDPCAMTAVVTDLTNGDFAPAVDPMDPSTFRRAPNVVEIVEIDG